MILSIKLVSGQEIMGRADGYLELHLLPKVVTLSKIKMLNPQMAPNGAIGFSLVPWMMSNPEGEIELDLRVVALAITKPEQRIEDSYIQQTSDVKVVKNVLQLAH